MPYTYYVQDGNIGEYWRNVDADFIGSMSSCYPQSYGYQHYPNVTAMYSPGVCPHGYAAAQAAFEEGDGLTSWCCPL